MAKTKAAGVLPEFRCQKCGCKVAERQQFTIDFNEAELQTLVLWLDKNGFDLTGLKTDVCRWITAMLEKCAGE